MSYHLDSETMDVLPARAGRGFKARIFAQPIVSLQTGLLKRFELLARIRSNSAETDASGVSENEKIYADLERSNAIIAHDLDVFRHAHRVLSTLVTQMPYESLPSLAVNFSPKTLSSEAFAQTLESIAAKDARLLSKIVLEVTERYDFDDLARARNNLLRASHYGMDISQDDVPQGTCAALLHDETRGLVSTIKLVEEGVLSLRQVAGIAFNPSLYKTVREMIETAGDMERARNAGMTFGQGYFFGRPVPLSEALDGWGDPAAR
ncbi:MAG: EAL domain-containing protein [Pseudobdellovibrionaceae bacterium]